MKPFQVWCCTERALKLKLGSLRNIEILALFHGPWWWICRYGAEVRYKPGKLKFAYGPVADVNRTVEEENPMLILTDSQKVTSLHQACNQGWQRRSYRRQTSLESRLRRSPKAGSV